jgi:arylsulfatase A-like enzyme
MATASQPNVLFFFTDDQRFDTIAALGNEQIHTPTLDKLVARGTTFTHAHIPSGSSAAVCMPSRAMLHTGRTLFHIAGRGEEIDPSHTTMGQAFGDAGYRTFGTGKWHNGTESFNRSFGQGAEIYFGGMEDHWNVPACNYDPTGQYAMRIPKCSDPYFSRTVYQHISDHVTPGKHSTELFADATIDFLNTCSTDAPFFAYVSFMAPHDPRTMPPQFLEMYDPAALDLPPNMLAEHPFPNGATFETGLRDEVLAAHPRQEAEIRQHVAEYYAMITHLDFEIGRVLETLEARGLAENTIIVFAGDNGLAVGQHGLMGKQSCYEHSLRVPLIFAGPTIPAGAKCDSYAYLLDIFPTLCDLCHVPRPDSVEGLSLARAIAAPDTRVRETLFAAYLQYQRCVKDDRYKLVEYVVDGVHSQTQLFDLQDDPWELTNLADTPEHQQTRDRLRGLLADYRDTWDDNRDDLGAIFWRSCELG